MMGTKARHFTPIPAVSLEQLVPAGHFYHHLDRVLSLSSTLYNFMRRNTA
jgi:hypothetical protein